MNPLDSEKHCLGEAQLLRYLNDECSLEEARAIDRHLDSCPLCSAAVEGLMTVEKEELHKTLENINKHIIEKTTKINNTNQTTTMLVLERTPKRWLWAAAAASTLTLSTTLWFFNRPTSQKNSEAATAFVLSSDSLRIANTASRSADTNTIKAVQPDSVSVASTVSPDSTLTAIAATDANISGESSANYRINEVAHSNAETEQGVLGEAKKQQMPPSPQAELAVSEDMVAAKPVEAVAPPMSAEPVKEKKEMVTARKQIPSTSNSSIKVLENEENLYREGHAFYKNGVYPAAIERFNRIVVRKGWGDLYENSLWYMADSYIKNGDSATAKTLLERIVREKGRYAKDAEKMLKRF